MLAVTSMRTNLQIDKKDYSAFYLYLYYNSKNRLIRVLRYIGGPILILLSFYMLDREGKFSVAYGGFCLGYGIYYLLKPFLELLLKRFAPQDISLEINGAQLSFETKDGKSEVNISRLKTYKTKQFFVIQLENNQSVFLPKKKLGTAAKAELEEQIT